MRHENEQNENKIKMDKIKKWKNKTKITEKIKLKKEIIYQFSVDDMYICDYMKQAQKNPRNIVEAINVYKHKIYPLCLSVSALSKKTVIINSRYRKIMDFFLVFFIALSS